MKYLLIENKGELDINSLILMGASSKRESNTAIGFYGSGNKYAISLLVREGYDFHIFSGNREIEITTKPITFREQEFKQILIDGRETSITSDMGPKWTPWMAIREIFSNAIDEGQHNVVTSIENIEGKEGYTRIYIPHTQEIKEVIDHWDEYFAFDRTDVIQEDETGVKLFKQINPNKHTLLYRKGIKCYGGITPSLYHYDFPNFEINESRIIENVHDAACLITEWLSKKASVEVARNILTNGFKDGYWEGNFSWYYRTSNFCKSWRTAIGNAIIVVNDVSGYFIDKIQSNPHYIVSTDMARAIKNYLPDVVVYGIGPRNSVVAKRKLDPSPKTSFILKKAQEFLKETQYEIKSEIEIAEFSDKSVLGCAEDGVIQLSEHVFDKGIREVVLTIMEENEHLVSGCYDTTRSFQDHLFNLLLKEKEERFGYFL